MIKEIDPTTEHYEKLVKILGIEQYVKAKIESPYDFIRLASKGINAKAVKNFKTYFKISQEETAHMLNISSPTLYRWINSNKNLEKEYAILLLDLTDLFLYGMAIFSSKENFIKWLHLPNSTLGGLQPQQLLEIPGGIAKVKDMIGRINHGVYS